MPSYTKQRHHRKHFWYPSSREYFKPRKEVPLSRGRRSYELKQRDKKRKLRDTQRKQTSKKHRHQSVVFSSSWSGLSAVLATFIFFVCFLSLLSILLPACTTFKCKARRYSGPLSQNRAPRARVLHVREKAIEHALALRLNTIKFR